MRYFHEVNSMWMKDKPRRIQRKRINGWRMPGNTKSVARPGRWGNPFPVSGHRTADEAVTMFRDALENGALPFTVEDVRWDLAGKNLACFCRLDQPCHADVLLETANRENILFGPLSKKA